MLLLNPQSSRLGLVIISELQSVSEQFANSKTSPKSCFEEYLWVSLVNQVQCAQTCLTNRLVSLH